MAKNVMLLTLPIAVKPRLQTTSGVALKRYKVAPFE